MKVRMLIKAVTATSVLCWIAIVGSVVTVSQFSVTTQAQAQSSSACERYAHDQARRRSQRDALGSAATGALVGAGIGSLVNNSRGARRGAALGAGASLLTVNSEYERHFNRAYRRCMGI